MARIASIIGLLLLSLPARAAEVPPEVQVQLQATMQEYVAQVSIDGAYMYIDHNSGELKTVYPANVHPMVLTFGDDYFVCSEMVDQNGDHIPADFLVREFEDGFRVTQMIVHNRALVEAAMAKMGGM